MCILWHFNCKQLLCNVLNSNYSFKWFQLVFRSSLSLSIYLSVPICLYPLNKPWMPCLFEASSTIYLFMFTREFCCWLIRFVFWIRIFPSHTRTSHTLMHLLKTMKLVEFILFFQSQIISMFPKQFSMVWNGHYIWREQKKNQITY